MGCSVILVLVILLYPNACNTNMILNKFKILENYKNVPKVWHRYIRAFIYRYHKNNIWYSIHIKNFLKILENFKNFKIIKAKTYVCSGKLPWEVTLKSP